MNADSIVDLITGYGLRFIFALIFFMIGWYAIKLVIKFTAKTLERRLEPTLSSFLISLFKALLIILLLITAASTVGIEMASFVVVLGAVGFAVGFALQGSLSNFAGGVLLLLFKPFKVGDFIDTGNYLGKVQEIQLLYTILSTPDNRRVYVPNGSLANSSIINFSVHETRRVDLVFGIGYDDDFEEAKDIIKKIIADTDLALDEPAPLVRVGEHAGSSININTKIWTETGNYWEVYYYMHEEVKRRFDKAGIGIPYPQMDIHFDPSVTEGIASRKEQ
ncbi:MAG: mechanosensitive ion channel family protein [Bacillota bacterium]